MAKTDSADDSALASVQTSSSGMSTLQHDSSRDTVMTDAGIGDALATPTQAIHDEDLIMPSGSLNRPVTRSMSKLLNQGLVDSIAATPASQTQLFQRLQSVSSKASKKAETSRLEDARDIQYDEQQADERDDDGGDDIDMAEYPFAPPKRSVRAGSIRSDVGQLRVPGRQSERIKSRGKAQRKLASKSGVQKRTKKSPKERKKITGPLRRSARLAKPLTEFHKYIDLPDELKICVWEAAIEPRVVYIRNRAALNYTNHVQTKRPSWFMASGISVDVAKQNYKKMFALHTPLGQSSRQDVNPDIDIIALEPCCSGCRGLYCARHQFTDEDRNAIRLLACQTDSPYLVSTAAPGWVTVSLAWPNVETLYLMQTALRGDQRTEKALIRIKEGQREALLRKRFDEWKKGVGQGAKLANLEFVVVIDKETAPAAKDRYKDVLERKTGLVEDIIVG